MGSGRGGVHLPGVVGGAGTCSAQGCRCCGPLYEGSRLEFSRSFLPAGGLLDDIHLAGQSLLSALLGVQRGLGPDCQPSTPTWATAPPDYFFSPASPAPGAVG